MRRLALVACAALVLAGCGDEGGSDRPTVAFLFANGQDPREPFTDAVEELCDDCAVLTENAEGDAGMQQEQAEKVLDEGADVLIVQPVDGASAGRIVDAAHDKNVPVVGYEAAIRGTEPDYTVAYDDRSAGKLQAEALLDRIGDTPGRIVMLNGPAGDGNAKLLKLAAHAVLDPTDHQVVREYDSPDTTEETGQREMADAIAKLGPNGFVGVYAATDDLARGATAALEAAGIDVPVTGTTVERPVDALAEKAAEFATALANGDKPPDRTAAVPLEPAAG